MDFENYREDLIDTAEQEVLESVDNDDFITQTINSLEDLEEQINQLTNRLREWYGLKDFEALRKYDSQKLALKILQEDEFFEKHHTEAIQALAANLHGLVKTKEFLQMYLEKVMQDHCKNLAELAGVKLGAKLLREAGGLEEMAKMPAGTIQVLGAESALFKHLSSGAPSPKHGMIINHPLVGGRKNKGKAARKLSQKLSHCARLDFFDGPFKAPQYAEELEGSL